MESTLGGVLALFGFVVGCMSGSGVGPEVRPSVRAEPCRFYFLGEHILPWAATVIGIRPRQVCTYGVRLKGRCFL